MKTAFEIQTEAGPLWPDIVALLKTKDDEAKVRIADAEKRVAEIFADRDSLAAELSATREKTSLAVKTAAAALADTALNDEATLAVISSVIDEVTKDARTREREALEAQQAEIAARLKQLG